MDELPVDQIEQIVERHGGMNARIFGSRARGEAHADSDLDILIQAGPDLTLLGLAAMTNELKELLGIPVEVITEGGLHPLLKERVLAEAKPLIA